MSYLSVHERLNSLLSQLSDSRLLKNQGIGNEISFYVFDYDPEHEPLVQQYLIQLKSQLQASPYQLNVLEINLYQVILQLLAERNLLDQAIALEEKQGNASFIKRIRSLVRPEQVVAYLKTLLTGDEQLIFLTGVGASYPLLRSHTILNNLHSLMDKTPLVMFFPGSYDGHELRLFNILKDDNYYRAFPLMPRSINS